MSFILCQNHRITKEEYILKTNEKNIGHIAVEVATQGENGSIGRPGIKFDGDEFAKFVGIWLITAAILFGALMIITIVKGSENLFRDTIKEVDTLNMMFSLVLSALLEQIWSKDVNKGKLYSFTLGVEGVLTVIGAMLFIAYSIAKVVAPQNDLLEISFELNLGYIIASMIVVLLGFVSRSLIQKI